MIYTSYFANLKNLPDTITPISICGKAPDFYKGIQFKTLAPKYDFLNNEKSTKTITTIFIILQKRCLICLTRRK